MSIRRKRILDLDKIVPDKDKSDTQIRGEEPPIGIMPRDIHDHVRGDSILAAMERYSEEGLAVPLEWVNELQDIWSRS